MLKYNTTKPTLILREYGRNIQKLVDYVTTIEDKEKRTQYAHTLIELMKQINPAMKEGPEYAQKLWDDLYIMSEFNLEVDSPYPMPEKDLLGKKPKRLDYHQNEVKFKHYGRNIELLIQKAAALENEEEKEAAIIYIGKLMKGFYNSWNKENIDESVVVNDIKSLSGNQLDIDVNKVKENNLFDSFTKENKTRRPAGVSSSKTSGGPKRRTGNPKRRKN